MQDKNYNVDDILSEIKSRKSRQKSSSAPPTQPAAPRQPAGPSPSVQPSPDNQPVDRPTSGRREDSPQWREPDGFQFSLPQQQPKEKAGPPLEFDGHVRSIAEKARMRPNRFVSSRHPDPTVQPPVSQPAPSAQRDLVETVESLDLSRIREAAHQAVASAPPEQQPAPSPPSTRRIRTRSTQEEESHHTRVLPKFSTGRLADSRQLPGLDFEAAARELDEGYYQQDPDDEPEQFIPRAAPDLGEYNSESDRRDVAVDIAKVKLWLLIRGSVTAILTVVLGVLALSGRYLIPLPQAIFPDNPDTVSMYFLSCTLLAVLVALVNSSAVGGGLMSLFKMRSNSDTLVSLALLAAIFQGVAATVRPEWFDPTQLNLYQATASLAMLFNALGKMTMINRIQSNFKILSSPKEKKALLAVQSQEFCHRFLPDSSQRKPTIAFATQAGFFTDFLALSYSDKYDVGINRGVAPVCLLGSLVVGGSTYFLTESIPSALSAFVAILCVCATFSATFIENIPLGKLTKKLAPQGGMVSGNKAVEDFCDTKAIILSENDLFPQGNVRLLGIKTYQEGRIDEAILDAASIVCSQGGALAPVFLEMIGSNTALLKKVENLSYENGLGSSGWVASRRILLGSKAMMERHGVTMPGDADQPMGPAEALYLSNSGELVARFMVGYSIDEELALQLDLLAVQEKMLIAHTTDPNLTQDKIWELYGYPQHLIAVMPAQLHEQYSEISAPKEKVMAEIVYTGRAGTMVKAILACITARTSILQATVLQLVQIVLGYGLVAFLAFMGELGSVSIIELFAYQSFWFLLIFVLQKTKQS